MVIRIMLSNSVCKAFSLLQQTPCPCFQSSRGSAAAVAENLGKDKINVCASEVQGKEKRILLRAQVNTEVLSGGRRCYFRNIKPVYF